MKDHIYQTLTAHFSPLALEVRDESAGHRYHAENSLPGNSHFHILMTSDKFTAVGRVQRERLVHQALRDIIPQIHALRLTIKAPSES